jgi:O-methyltransferase involved in polyketide biosynthesis
VTSSVPGRDAGPTELSAVSSTLRVPLAARAFGDTWFPSVAVGDRSAAAVMMALGGDRQSWPVDPATVYCVLARTRKFRTLAQSFIVCRPRSTAVNLGCGLANYFQWLDNGRNRWIDVDLEHVVSLRRELLPLSSSRQRLIAADLTQPGWWSRLGLGAGTPVFVMCEGLLMYLEPDQVRALLSEIATYAPPGTQIVLDAIHWLSAGAACWCPPVRRTGAEFRWGLRRVDELAAIHPRLTLLAEHDLAQLIEMPYSIPGSAFRFYAGAPFYGVYQLVVGDW